MKNAFPAVRRWLASLLAVLIFCAFTYAARAGDFETANELFDKGKFSEAGQLYGDLVKRGEWSAALFFNLGNTQFRLGEPGRAVLNFERALALEPGHEDAAANLKLVRERSGAHVAERPWVEMLFPQWRLDGFAIAAAVLLWAAVFLWVGSWMTRRRSNAWLWTGAIAATLAGIYAATPIFLHRADATLAVVLPAKQAEARLAPADRAGLAEMLPAGSRVQVLRERGEWTYCLLPGKTRGWLPSTALEKVHLPRS